MQNTMNPNTEKTKSSNGKWAAQAQKSVESEISGLTDSARKIYDEAVETGADFISQANKRATEMVREYPVSAALGGICVGFLLGASLFGRSQKKG